MRRVVWSMCGVLLLAVGSGYGFARLAKAVGPRTAVSIHAIDYEGGQPAPRPSAPLRLAWELRTRTSVESRLEPTRGRWDDPELFAHPFAYWSGDRAFAPLSDAEISGLRRFVVLGGLVLIDDASPSRSGFDSSVRRALGRAFPRARLERLPSDHTVYRAFYLIDRPLGAVQGPDHLQALERDGRAAVIYSRHDLGGAWARDNLGNWKHPVAPGGAEQREEAFRLGVNLVMYALTLDYKDDQVHVPFIMRRQAGKR